MMTMNTLGSLASLWTLKCVTMEGPLLTNTHHHPQRAIVDIDGQLLGGEHALSACVGPLCRRDCDSADEVSDTNDAGNTAATAELSSNSTSGFSGVAGTLALMVREAIFLSSMFLKPFNQIPNDGSADMTEVASLVATSANDTLSPLVLDASTVNSTQFTLNKIDPDSLAMSSIDPSSIPSAKALVTLSFSSPGNDSSLVKDLCATFDPAPSSPVQFSLEGCFLGSEPDHKSQLFLYDQQTNEISPMWRGQAVSSTSAASGSEATPSGTSAKDPTDTNDLASMAMPAAVDPPTPIGGQIASVTEVGDNLGKSTNPFDALGSSITPAGPPVSSTTSSLGTPSPPTSSAGGQQNVVFVFKPADPSSSQARERR
jgi:hypothetical protein